MTMACGSASATAAFPSRSLLAAAALAPAASTCLASRRPRGPSGRPRRLAPRPCLGVRRREGACLLSVWAQYAHPPSLCDIQFAVQRASFV